ncbi:MAG: peptidoglycan DD-metalloendopeptidase family protein [Pseudomonadota bacterium]
MRLFLAILVLCASPGFCQTDPASAADRAYAALTKATEAMARAEEADARIDGLTEAILAFESGLAAMREAERRAARRQSELEAGLKEASHDLSTVLAALQAATHPGSEGQLLHPDGPLGTARAAMLMAAFTPALDEQVARYRDQLQELVMLENLRDSAAADISEAVDRLRIARTELVAAAQTRDDLPVRAIETPTTLAVLVAASETLAAFAGGLSSLPGGPVDDTFANHLGALPLPVEGATRSAGTGQPGFDILAAPGALVSTPVTATVRFRGALLDYGNVIILEPAPEYLLVLGGLGQILGTSGQVLPPGAPIGFMPDDGVVSEVDGAEMTTLYVETRQSQDAVDPMTWFALDEENE